MSYIDRVSFSEFLQSAHFFHQGKGCKDVSGLVKRHDNIDCFQVNPSFGAGKVSIVPLMAGATLITMSFTPKNHLEIYEKNIQQTGLSFTVCLSGQVKCLSDKDALTISENESCFQRHQQNTNYGASVFTQAVTHQYLTLHLSYDWLSERGRSLGLAIVNDNFWSGMYSLGHCSDEIIALSQSIYNDVNGGDMAHHKTSALCLALWSLQLDKLQNLKTMQGGKVLKKAQDIARIHQAAQILRDNIQSPPDLLSLARQIGINDHKLKRGFKELYQETVFSYLRKNRLDKAKELLAKCNGSISDTSHSVGYDSSSHFSVAFKKEFGLTPRDYQKRAQALNN